MQANLTKKISRFLQKNQLKTSTILCEELKPATQNLSHFGLIFIRMTFGDKLKEMREESLHLQREFLIVIGEIRVLATKGDALTEELIFRRDKLYNQFNKILKGHHKLTNYVTENAIHLGDEYTEPEGF